MTGVRCERLSGTDSDSIQTGIAKLLTETDFHPESRVLVLPDAHYPYHPSTGQVTNPDVVGEFVESLDAEIAIGISGSRYINADRVGRYLGYERLADKTGATLVDLDAADRVDQRVHFTGGLVSLGIPEPLLEDDVVVVPTLCQSPRFGVADGMVTLARAVTDDPTREEIIAATRVCWPILSILDGTFAPAAERRRTDVLLVSDDVVSLSNAAADLLGVERSDIPHLGPRRMLPSPLQWLGNALSSRRPTAGDDMMAKGYRLYAQMTGDLVPPQMFPEDDHE